LWYACPKDNLDVIKLLLEVGEGVLTLQEKDSMGRTFLHAQVMAIASRQDMKVVSFLLSRGIGIDAKDNKGRTALWYAGKNGLDQVERLLLEMGGRLGFGVHKDRGW